jgi:hypothetical protein
MAAHFREVPFGIGNAIRRRGGCWNVSLLIYPE